MANHQRPIETQPPAPLPARIAYGLERRPGNTWVRIRYHLAGERVVRSEESDPDTFLAQIGRLEVEMRRIVR